MSRLARHRLLEYNLAAALPIANCHTPYSERLQGAFSAA